MLTVNHTAPSAEEESQEESIIASEIVENVLKSAASEIKSEEEADLESEILVQSDDEEVSISEHASDLENVSDLDPLPSPQAELELPSPVCRPDEPSPTVDTPYLSLPLNKNFSLRFRRLPKRPKSKRPKSKPRLSQVLLLDLNPETQFTIISKTSNREMMSMT